jgi:hypothetical protein
MKTEELWQEMEAEANAVGWSTRLARPEPGCQLLVALDHSTRSRAILLRANVASIPPRREWPACRGLELRLASVGTDTYLSVRLRDAAARDVFAALAEMLAARLMYAGSEKDVVAELFGGLRRWQTFLAAAHDGLGVEVQRGLFGELYLLDLLLVPTLGPRAAAQGWKGFAHAHQDFQFSTGAVEVKTTAATVPNAVRITSVRQLDGTGVGELFLFVLIVDDRDVSPPGAGGVTLAGLVARCRRSLASDSLALALLDEGLLQMGWLDAHADRYDGRRLTVRAQRCFHVREGFPRLLERGLPVGVGDVTYTLDLAACQTFEVKEDFMLLTLAHPVVPPAAPPDGE